MNHLPRYFHKNTYAGTLKPVSLPVETSPQFFLGPTATGGPGRLNMARLGHYNEFLGPTDRRTNPLTNRDARMHLKKCEKESRLLE